MRTRTHVAIPGGYVEIEPRQLNQPSHMTGVHYNPSRQIQNMRGSSPGGVVESYRSGGSERGPRGTRAVQNRHVDRRLSLQPMPMRVGQNSMGAHTQRRQGASAPVVSDGLPRMGYGHHSERDSESRTTRIDPRNNVRVEHETHRQRECREWEELGIGGGGYAEDDQHWDRSARRVGKGGR